MSNEDFISQQENGTPNNEGSYPVKRKNFLLQILSFIWSKKVYWIVPVIIFLILLIFLIAVGTSPVSPFIYTII